MMDLQANEQAQRFCRLLETLNHQLRDIHETGDIQILDAMNETVQEMFNIQHGSKEGYFVAIDEDMQAICKNFNAIVLMRSTDAPDEVVAAAIGKFLAVIYQKHVNIINTLGLA